MPEVACSRVVRNGAQLRWHKSDALWVWLRWLDGWMAGWPNGRSLARNYLPGRRPVVIKGGDRSNGCQARGWTASCLSHPARGQTGALGVPIFGMPITIDSILCVYGVRLGMSSDNTCRVCQFTYTNSCGCGCGLWAPDWRAIMKFCVCVWGQIVFIVLPRSACRFPTSVLWEFVWNCDNGSISGTGPKLQSNFAILPW